MTGFSLASALLFAPLSVLAQEVSDASVSLKWQAPPGCPNGSALLGRVRALVSAEATERVTARGVVTEPQAGGPWQLTLETVQGARTWQRSLRAGSCEELADAGALIIALVLDPTLKTQPDDPLASSVPTAQPIQPGTSASLPPRPPTTPSERPAASTTPAAAPVFDRKSRAQTPSTGLDLYVAASAIGDYGSMPRVALGGEIAAGIGLEPVELELSAMMLPEVRKVIAADRGGKIRLIAGGLRGCYRLNRTAVTWRFCGGFEAGQIRGIGFGTTGWTDERSLLWMAGRLGAFGRYPLIEPLALRFGLEGLLPLTRPEFMLENVGSVHEPNTALVRLELGFELLFR